MTGFLTPGAILDYWIGPATDDHLAADRLHKLWFTKSTATDKAIATRFEGVLHQLGERLADRWAQSGARSRLAAIIVLDQFSRNIYRGRAGAFATDALALRLAAEGVQHGDDQRLTEVERSFFYLPFEHSEDLADQDRAVMLFETLAIDAREAFRPMMQNALDYAHQHRDIIRRFGRFPHRNTSLGRENTTEEADYLARPGAGF